MKTHTDSEQFKMSGVSSKRVNSMLKKFEKVTNTKSFAEFLCKHEDELGWCTFTKQDIESKGVFVPDEVSAEGDEFVVAYGELCSQPKDGVSKFVYDAHDEKWQLI